MPHSVFLIVTRFAAIDDDEDDEDDDDEEDDDEVEDGTGFEVDELAIVSFVLASCAVSDCDDAVPTDLTSGVTPRGTDLAFFAVDLAPLPLPDLDAAEPFCVGFFSPTVLLHMGPSGNFVGSLVFLKKPNKVFFLTSFGCSFTAGVTLAIVPNTLADQSVTHEFALTENRWNHKICVP